MNILFYVEQHPIRGSYTKHVWLVKRLAAMLEDEFVNKQHACHSYDFKMVLNSAQSRKALISKKTQKNWVLPLSFKEEESLQAFCLPWEDEALTLWRDLMKGQGPAADFCEAVLTRIKSIYDFDVVVYWGANGAVRSFAQAQGIPALAMELGCTRDPFPSSVYMDSQGVNGLATPRNLPLEKALVRHSLDDIKHALMSFDKISPSFLPRLLQEALRHPLEKNVLIALQLKEDANVLSYSPYGSMLEFLKEILPPLNQQGYRCFVKAHPLGLKAPINAKDHRDCEDYCKQFDTVTWIEEGAVKDPRALFEQVSTVLSINSSVGFEAMILGKTVLAFGEAPYKKPGFLPSFEVFLRGEVDLQKVRENNEKIVNYLLFSYLLPRETVFNYGSFCGFVERTVFLSHCETTEEYQKLSERLPLCSLKEGGGAFQRKGVFRPSIWKAYVRESIRAFKKLLLKLQGRGKGLPL